MSDWNDESKNFIRSTVYSQLNGPIRNGIILPGVDCLGVLAAIDHGKYDDLSHFICLEKDSETAEIIEANMNSIGVSFEMQVHYDGLQKKSLVEIMGNRVSNFAYFDTCSVLTKNFYDYYLLYLHHYGNIIFDEDALIAFNHVVGGRGSSGNILAKEPYSPTIALWPQHITKEMKKSPYLMGTMASVLPHKVKTSIMTPYQQKQKTTPMLNTTFQLEKRG